MKVLSSLIVISLILSGCSSESSDILKDSNASPSSDQIEVQDGLTLVSITIPGSLYEEFGGITQSEIDEAVQEGNFISGSLAEDGSVTYTMTKLDHLAFMEELSSGLIEYFEELKTEFSQFKNIEMSSDLKTFTITVDRLKYENDLLGSISILGLVFSGLLLQLFSGVNPDDYDLTVVLVDSTTNKEFKRMHYPEAFEN